MIVTVGEAMRVGAAKLRDAGIPDPMRDARRLMAFALAVPASRITLAERDALSKDAQVVFDKAIAARSQAQPVAQITGAREFYGRQFRVTRDTLDPRPETETLVAAALEWRFKTVLDLGTGTGAILVSLLAEREGATGVGTDISPAALDVARENAAAHQVKADFIHSDWFEALPEGRFDLIVSNPPYIAQTEMAGLSRDVREWEPETALTDGADGLNAYRAIAANLADYLSEDGMFFAEFGIGQGPDIQQIFEKTGATTGLIKDLDGRDRVIQVKYS